ncbi:MAG: hypothetical protein KID00_05040 [Clostridium argentinense]|nr:hypothetical protein [Clostridium butanoliproducens]MBS5823216.1 hypothetical protein [Clostridium argentinense]MDU1349010.1 hypothetical protein [Clostridium argentinense]
MKNNKFISNKYITIKEKRTGNIIKAVTIVLYIIFILNLFFLKFNIDKVNGCKIRNKEKENFSKEEVKKEIVTVEKFNNLMENLNLDRFNIKFINVNEDSIELEIFVEDKKQYVNSVRTIENKYNIKDLTPMIYDVEKRYFRVVL